MMARNHPLRKLMRKVPLLSRTIKCKLILKMNNHQQNKTKRIRIITLLTSKCQMKATAMLTTEQSILTHYHLY